MLELPGKADRLRARLRHVAEERADLDVERLGDPRQNAEADVSSTVLDRAEVVLVNTSAPRDLAYRQLLVDADRSNLRADALLRRGAGHGALFGKAPMISDATAAKALLDSDRASASSSERRA